MPVFVLARYILAGVKGNEILVKLILHLRKIVEVNEKDWGLRDLAYEINFQSKGYYVVLTVEAENDLGVKEFERQCRIDTQNVLREMTVAL